MSDLAPTPASTLLGRTRDRATLTEQGLKRFAAEAARDHDEHADRPSGSACWAAGK